MGIAHTYRAASREVSDLILAGGKAVTPSDSVDVDKGDTYYAFLVGVAGDVKFTMADDTTVTITNVVAGHIHRLAFTRIWSTGTDATGIVAFR